MVIGLDFGFYPRPLHLSARDLSIETLDGLDEKVADVKSSDGIEGDWIYAPPQQVHILGGGIAESPYSSRVFGLPKTHRIEHANAVSPEHVIFHLWSLSFFQGIRLTSTEAGFLDAANIRPGAMIDFVSLGRTDERAIELTEAFWQTHQSAPRAPQLVSAIIHALFLAQTPRLLMFERFTPLYMAIDACFALARLVSPATPAATHAKRIKWLCQTFGLVTPAWAVASSTAPPAMTALRNQTFHEALFGDQPLGFAAQDLTSIHEMMIDLQGLICRLLIALLGGTSDYIATPLSDRQRHGLELT